MKFLTQLTFILLIFHYQTRAQVAEKNIPGEYYLEGVMEVGSGFQLKEDHTFNFFFSYGALDRVGKGTWKLADDKIVFNSEPWPGSDFVLAKQEHRNSKQIIIQVTDANTTIIGQVGCIISGGGKTQKIQTEQDGTATFEPQQVDSIVLFHLYFSDEMSVFPAAGDDNYFEFTFQPWLGTVFFKDFSLAVNKEGLTGGHPLLKEEREYSYAKSK